MVFHDIIKKSLPRNISLVKLNVGKLWDQSDSSCLADGYKKEIFSEFISRHQHFFDLYEDNSYYILHDIIKFSRWKSRFCKTGNFRSNLTVWCLIDWYMKVKYSMMAWAHILARFYIPSTVRDRNCKWFWTNKI